MMSRLFDAYVMVDWSANSRPKRGKDSIWAGVAAWNKVSKLEKIKAENLRTREEAEEHIQDLLVKYLEDGQRVLLGFDFPYGYPAGFADALELGHGGAPWNATWEYWDDQIEDRPRNENNRFAVASSTNDLVSGSQGPFWACPKSKISSFLSAKKLKPRPITKDGKKLRESRWTEEWLKNLGYSSIQSVWKLLYPGSVGSQVLVGIPRLRQLRFHPDLAAQSVVWPFETGFTLKDTEAQIVHAEIWPSVLRKVYNEDGTCTDEKQVRSLVRHFAELDDQGKLAAEFERPPCLTDEQVQQVIEEEGWILGATTAKPVRSLKKQSRKASR